VCCKAKGTAVNRENISRWEQEENGKARNITKTRNKNRHKE
jgi:hypothetical protein